jgi:hypothetical protein
MTRDWFGWSRRGSFPGAVPWFTHHAAAPGAGRAKRPRQQGVPPPGIPHQADWGRAACDHIDCCRFRRPRVSRHGRCV